MENNELNEKIQRKVKEKIAIFNLGKELKMRKESRRKLIYTLSSSAAVFILGIGVLVGTNQLNDMGIDKTPYQIAELEQNNCDLEVKLNINKINIMGALKLDADVKIVNDVYIPYFNFLSNLTIPKDFDSNENYRVIYTRGNNDSEEYNILNNYVFEFRNTNNRRRIILAFSDKYKPIRDSYIYDEEKKVSKIGDAELYISNYDNMYMTLFNYKGINFDIETYDISETELVEFIKSIIN